ncbi:Holliday junction branch migration protein RuvA [bacterium]|nr:Holliday junction branch migration protein RuvA [bacterium]
MLHSLKGTLVDFEEDFAVIDVGGVRFQVEIPASTAGQLGASGDPAEVLTRLSFNANDGTFSLYGFATPMERDCFDVLTSMSGIGPRKALAILSQIEVAAFANAIVNKDIAYVGKIKGVGKKTAERLIVELREKMVPFMGSASAAPIVSSRPENVQDAIEALMALGCKQITAEKAIGAAIEILDESAPTEDLVREGLRHR